MLKKFFYIGLTFAAVAATASLNSNSKAKLRAEDYIFTCEGCHTQTYGVAPALNSVEAVESPYSDFKSFYFDNLTQNFGMNYKGSCGYVAIGMMLSYYDTVLSDDVIPERYDVNSVGTTKSLTQRRNNPGILKDVITSDYPYIGYELSAEDYYNIVTSMSGYSLHGELIRVGSLLGYYDFNDDYNPAGLSVAGVVNVLGNTLREFGFEYNEHYSMTLASNDNAKPFAIEQINQGNPVFLFIVDGQSGHVCVGYDYNSSNDTVYCHMGWDENMTHTSPEEVGLPEIVCALSLDFNINYKASNNYVLLQGSNRTYYSSKEINSSYELHKHDYTDHYSKYSKNQHKAYCECGEYVLRPHSVKVGSTTTGRGIMRAVCEDCGALIDLGTTPVIAYN